MCIISAPDSESRDSVLIQDFCSRSMSPFNKKHSFSQYKTFKLYIQAGLLLRDFLLRYFTSTLLETLHHFLNLHSNAQFNTIWHGQNVAALVLCWRLAESHVTFPPSVTCMDWLCWWYKHAAGVNPPSSSLAFGMQMIEKRKSMWSSVMQVKNQQKLINIEKLKLISQLEKVNEFFLYAVMSGMLILVYVQFLMLIELQSVKSRTKAFV